MNNEALITQSLNETTNELVRKALHSHAPHQSFSPHADYRMAPLIMLAIMYFCSLLDLFQPYQVHQSAESEPPASASEQKELFRNPSDPGTDARDASKDRMGDRYATERMLQIFFISSLFVQHCLGISYIAWRVSERPYDPVSFREGLGFILVIAGAALRIWARVTLGRLFTYLVSVRSGHQLVTSGPYQWMLHPSYTGALVVGLGYFMFTHSIGAAIVMLSVAAYWLSLRVSNEEEVLAREFGQVFLDRKAKVARFIPYVY